MVRDAEVLVEELIGRVMEEVTAVVVCGGTGFWRESVVRIESRVRRWSFILRIVFQ
jgi:hypothetical protein